MRRTDVTTAKESNANVYYNFSMLITENILIDDDKHNDYRYKINYATIHDQPCKDFLYYAVLLFIMESNKANMVLQFSEGDFYPPAQLVDVFYILSREFIVPGIGNKSSYCSYDILSL